MYPSEYAFRDDSVSRADTLSANCRSYPSNLEVGVNQEDYIHCDGTQLKLTDSDLEKEQFSDYYQWPGNSDGELLFIFHTTVSLTTITLHYYSNNLRGLSRLRFYAVPDDFNAWNSPTTSTPHVDVISVPPDGEPASRRSVSISVNFNTECWCTSILAISNSL